MTPYKTAQSRTFLLFLGIVLLTCSPVWFVEYFLNQDGSAHVYSSQLMLEILRGNPTLGSVFELNSFSVPNSTGHWLMVPLLLFFSPFVVTKLMVTITFVGLAAAILWFRTQTAGPLDLEAAVLVGFVLSFNWLWMLGSYNFILGVIVFVFATGLFYRWREQLNFRRSLLFALLLVFAFLSHLISFLILSGSICVLAVLTEKQFFRRALFWTFAAFLPVLPLIFFYKLLSQSGEPFNPAWRHLYDPFSLKSWLAQLSAVDPFVLLSRKTLPFTTVNSKFFAFFSPLLWIAAAYFLLALATFYSGKFKELFSKRFLPFVLLFFFSICAAAFAPDDFGLTNGSVLRERILLCGLIFFVPLIRLENSRWLKRAAYLCMGFVIVFQTLVMWEYALRGNRKASAFLSAREAVSAQETVASVTIVENGMRFHSVVVTQMSNFFGFRENVVVWDNYEIGHYLFPVVAKSPADKQFVFALTTSNAFDPENPRENFEENLADLEKCLAEGHQKIQKLVFWGRDERIETVLFKWFDPAPLFDNGKVRVFRHK